MCLPLLGVESFWHWWWSKHLDQCTTPLVCTSTSTPANGMIGTASPHCRLAHALPMAAARPWYSGISSAISPRGCTPAGSSCLRRPRPSPSPPVLCPDWRSLSGVAASLRLPPPCPPSAVLPLSAPSKPPFSPVDWASTYPVAYFCKLWPRF
jgi:hypothetical protein